MLFINLSCKEIFIHTLCDIDIYIDSLATLISRHEDRSVLLVVKKMVFAYKPTTKQIATAWQLSINALKLMSHKGTFDTFNQIMRMVVSASINWTELDLSNCSIGEIECDVLYRCFKTKICFSTVGILKIPSAKLTMSSLSKLIEISLTWKVQELVFCGKRCFICEHYIHRFFTNKTLGEINLSVTYNNMKVLFLCNFSWDKIPGIPEVSTLYFIKCHHLSSIQIQSVTRFVKLPVDHISQIYIINSTLYENDIVNLLDIFIYRNMELSIYNINISISNEALCSFITKKEIFCRSKFSFVAAMKNFMCSYNATKDQLHLSQRLRDLESAVVSLAKASQYKQINERELFLFQNKRLITLHFVGMNDINVETANYIAAIVSHSRSEMQNLDLADNNLQASVMIVMMTKGLKEISTFKDLNMSNNQIAKCDIAASFSHNTQLQNLDVSNDLQEAGAKTLARGSHNITTLTKLCIKNNNIPEVAGDIAAFVSHNHQLQELDISNNHLQASGAKTLARGLHDVTTLTKFCISNNNITEDAAGDIASLLYHNIQLEEFNIAFNKLKSSGIMTIAPALQHIKNLQILNIKAITELLMKL